MRGAGGRYLIDPAELERAFGKLARTDARSDARTRVRTGLHKRARRKPRQADEAADIEARELELLRDQLEHERLERARERQAFDEERRFLRSLIESHGEQIRLLTRQAEPARRRWWFW